MEPAIVRPMVADEAPEVAALVLRANGENLRAFPREVASSYRSEILSLSAGMPPPAEVHVVSVDDRIVGAVTFLPDADADGHPWPPGGAVLRFLAVEPEARRRHLGEMLTLFCIDKARAAGSSFLALHTAPMMVAARRMYERLGFVRSPEHDFHPAEHYGARTDPAEPAWGLAYLLPLGSVA